MDINKYQIIAEMIFEKVKHYDEGVHYLEFYGEEYAVEFDVKIRLESYNDNGSLIGFFRQDEITTIFELHEINLIDKDGSQMELDIDMNFLELLITNKF